MFLIFTILLRECGCWERSALRSCLGGEESLPPTPPQEIPPRAATICQSPLA